MARVAHLAFYPLDVHRGVSEPRACFHSMGIRVSHLQPGRAVDYRNCGHGLGHEAGHARKHGRRPIGYTSATSRSKLGFFSARSFKATPQAVAMRSSIV